MNFKRIGRIAICLLLVCVLLFNIVSVKAKATGIVEGLIAGASAINVPAAIAICATLVALGVMGKAADTSGTNMNNLVNQAQAYLESAGGWIQDGTMELIRTIDEAGNAVYYAGVDLFETLRGWLFDSNTIVNEPVCVTSSYFVANGSTYSYSFSAPVVIGYTVNIGGDAIVWAGAPGSGDSIQFSCSVNSGNVASSKIQYDSGYSGRVRILQNIQDCTSITGIPYLGKAETSGIILQMLSTFSDMRLVAEGLSLGQVSTVPIDGTSAKEWAPSYADLGLYVIQGGGSGMDPDDGAEGNDNWKWMLPVSLAALIDLLIMSQADQWIGTTPSEFDDYTTSEEYDVTPQPEIDGYPAIEITPVVDPDTGGDTVTDPDDDSAELTWWQRFTKWFQELRTSINELPDRFDEHFENVNNNIEEVPSKFESWINGVQTSVDAVAESILGTADEINAAIQGLPDNFLSHVSVITDAIGAVPQAVVVGFRSALEALFVPDPDFIPNKVAALQAQYSFLEPMQQTGEDLKLFFQNIGSQPPIIWIDLGAGTGWYPMGGKVKFIDLTWYSQYKPTADFIVGGSIWLWLAWRMFKAIPGIISGDCGSVGAPVVAPDISFNTARLPVGRSRRKKDGD